MPSEQSATPIPLPVLQAFRRDVLQAVGVLPAGAVLIADSLVGADARGLSSHGVVHILPVYVRRLLAGTSRADPDVPVVARRGYAALVDGDAGPGQVLDTGRWVSRSRWHMKVVSGVSASATVDPSAPGPSFEIEQARLEQSARTGVLCSRRDGTNWTTSRDTWVYFHSANVWAAWCKLTEGSKL